jgi:dipeptidyl aminopeptidase/acylaminoacyl peptidase
LAKFWLLRPEQQHVDELHVPETAFGYRGNLSSDGQRLFYLGSSPSDFTCLVALDPATASREMLRRGWNRFGDPAYLSILQDDRVPDRRGLTAHAFYYLPVNRDYMAAPGERPPLIVANHGRPAGATTLALDLSTQFWTSCGFALVDVDHGGITSNGRAYRQRLNGQRGVVSLADCTNAARYLLDCVELDGRRIAIHGGSAGDYTAQSALIFSELFIGCAAHYDISDLETRAKETYKFEAHKADILVGPYPETRGRLRARSPIHFVDQASCHVMIQGLEDRIRPSSQAETMVAALREGRAGRRCPIRGRPPRLPAYREYPVRTRRGVVLLPAQLRFSTCRPSRAGHHREPLTLDRRRVQLVKRMKEGFPILAKGSRHVERA